MRLLSLCFFCACSFASDSTDLYPGAPAAASDYAFLIGHWQCQYEQLDPQGKVLFSAPCRWQAQYAFDNKMVVDDFSLLDAQGNLRRQNTQNLLIAGQALASGISARTNESNPQPVYRTPG